MQAYFFLCTIRITIKIRNGDGVMQQSSIVRRFGSYAGDWLFIGYCVLLLLIMSMTYAYVRSEVIARSVSYVPIASHIETTL